MCRISVSISLASISSSHITPCLLRNVFSSFCSVLLFFFLVVFSLLALYFVLFSLHFIFNVLFPLLHTAHILLPPFINFCLSISIYAFLSLCYSYILLFYLIFSRLPFLIHRFILPSTLLPLCLFFPSLRCLLSFPQFHSYTQFSLCSVFARSSSPITVTYHTIRNIPGLHPCPGFRLLGQYHASLCVRYCKLLSHAHTHTHTHHPTQNNSPSQVQIYIAT